jgi:IclR family acetate operon transcriptional repressor
MTFMVWDPDQPDGDDSRIRTTMAWRFVVLLEALAAHPEGIGIRDTARLTGIDKSALNRLLLQLEQIGVVEQDKPQGRYRTGPRLFAIGAGIAARDSVVLAGHAIIERISMQFNETCYLAVRSGNEFKYIDKVESNQPIRVVLDIGQSAPIHVGAAGRAMLAGMDDDAIRETLASYAPEKTTSRTIIDPDKLVREARKDRARGYSSSVGERFEGATGLASPFFGPGGHCVGSVVCTRPAARAKDRSDQLGRAVIAGAIELSDRIGGEVPTWMRKLAPTS